MPSYLITGANRGLGYEYVKQLGKDPQNIVIGLVRNAKAAEEKAAQDPDFKNVQFVQGDIIDRSSLLAARSRVEALTGGSLDYLINNAAAVENATNYKTLADFNDNPEDLEEALLNTFKVNVIGVANTVNIFIPLIEKGSVKKVVTISSGMADPDIVNQFEVDVDPAYSTSKAAVNLLVAKYNARYKRDGILFLAISPGYIDTGNVSEPPPPDFNLPQKFAQYAPHFKGPITAEESFRKVFQVIEDATLEKNGGAFLSHLGNKQWL